MPQVFVGINGKVISAKISTTVHSVLRTRIFLSGKPIDYFLRATIQEYGKLNEGNILRYLEEHKNF